jgi:outer membrane lipoprotein carrier protein
MCEARRSLVARVGVFVFLGVLSALMLPVSAEENRGKNVVAAIQEKYRGIASIEAGFEQRNYIASLDQYREFRGTLLLKRPNLFAMEVDFPSPQKQILDGEFFWNYTSATNQAVKSRLAPGFAEHPLVNLLTTMENLEKDFSVVLADREDSPDYSLTLGPKAPNADFQEVILAVSKQGLEVKEIIVLYESGDSTQLTLSHLKENPTIAPSRFKFTPPPGVEIVEAPVPRK